MTSENKKDDNYISIDTQIGKLKINKNIHLFNSCGFALCSVGSIIDSAKREEELSLLLALAFGIASGLYISSYKKERKEIKRLTKVKSHQEYSDSLDKNQK